MLSKMKNYPQFIENTIKIRHDYSYISTCMEYYSDVKEHQATLKILERKMMRNHTSIGQFLSV